MIKNINFSKKKAILNNNPNHYNLDEKWFSHKKQIEALNCLYLNIPLDIEDNIIKEFKSKLSSYKQQDKKRHLFCNESFISLYEIKEKLVTSKLKCIYCKEKLNIFYKECKNPKQWTLDRIDNNLGHSNINTVISCLECNLQRRRKKMETFIFSKQLKINKIN